MRYQTINPATAKVIHTFPAISDNELELAVSQADASYRNDWRHRSIADRARIVSAACGDPPRKG